MAPKTVLDLQMVRFLVADDSTFMRRLVASVLRAFGVRQIAQVSTGQEAYDEIVRRHHDVVLLDWEFPDRSGASVMRAIRRPGHRGAYQTVIMMSGHDEKRRIERAMKFGVNGYVAKPVAPAALYTQICQTILFPRPYLRTETYFGPQHPLIVDAIQKGGHQVHRDDKPRSSHDGERVDLDDLDDLSGVY